MQEGTVHMTPAQEKAFKREGLRVVFGGILIHFVLGTFYLWGGISVYVASYLRLYSDEVDIDLVKMVFPLMFVAINSTMSLGVKTAAKIGHKLMCVLTIICVSAAPVIVSFVTNYVIFIIIYTVMIGLASGMVYMTPIVCGWKYFPNRKGLISGAIIAGYGFGSFTFNMIALALVNPNNETATVVHDGHSYFGEDVASRVPFMLRILAIIYISVGAIGCLLVKMPRTIPTEHHEEHKGLVKETAVKGGVQHEYHECASIGEGVRSSPFWKLMGMVITGSFLGLLMANNYKVFGLEQLKNDSFVTLVGSVGSAANGCSRLFWAALYDRFGYKKVYFALMLLQCGVCATLYLISKTPALYLIWHSIIMATEGGQFSVMPTVSTKVFGPKIGPVIYGILYIGFSIANLSSFFLVKFALKSLGWSSIFWICFGLSVAAFLINLLFREDYKFENKYKGKVRVPETPDHHDSHHDDDHHTHDDDKH